MVDLSKRSPGILNGKDRFVDQRTHFLYFVCDGHAGTWPVAVPDWMRSWRGSIVHHLTYPGTAEDVRP